MQRQRFDMMGKLQKFERTPSGGLRIPAYISRTGVFAYQDAAGGTRAEFRPESEVLAESSYRSFEGAPVTVGHPEDLVTPATWREHAVGTVRNVRPDGSRIAADLYIEDAEAIRAIEAGELIETSSGYEADVTEGPGEHHGARYDAVQRNIRGNHVGLGPAGWGRAGSDVRLRLDGAGAVSGLQPGTSLHPAVRPEEAFTRGMMANKWRREAPQPSRTPAHRQDADGQVVGVHLTIGQALAQRWRR